MSFYTICNFEHGHGFQTGSEVLASLSKKFVNPIRQIRIDLDDAYPKNLQKGEVAVILESALDEEWATRKNLSILYRDPQTNIENDIMIAQSVAEKSSRFKWFRLTEAIECQQALQASGLMPWYPNFIQKFRNENYMISKVLNASRALYYCREMNHDISEHFWSDGYSIDRWLAEFGDRFDIVTLHELDKWIPKKYGNQPLDNKSPYLINQFGGMVILDHFHDLKG
jgi:hypothetical protein